MHRLYDEQVKSSSAQLVAQLTQRHEARLAHEVLQARAQVDMANERVQASETKAQLRLQEQAQRAEMLISDELRRALTETADQAIANTRTTAEIEVLLRKELLEAKHRLTELEPAWSVFIEKHNDKEEAQELEQRRRAAVTASPSELRNRRLKNEASRVELRVAASDPPSDAAAISSHLATPRGADNVLSNAREPASASTLGMFSPVSTGLESAREPSPSTVTVDSDAVRVTEFNHGILSGRVQEMHHENIGSFSATLLRQEELFPDSMRKTTLANLETKTLKAFRNVFAHHKNAHAKISDWVSYIRPGRASHAGASTNS